MISKRPSWTAGLSREPAVSRARRPFPRAWPRGWRFSERALGTTSGPPKLPSRPPALPRSLLDRATSPTVRDVTQTLPLLPSRGLRPNRTGNLLQGRNPRSPCKRRSAPLGVSRAKWLVGWQTDLILPWLACWREVLRRRQGPPRTRSCPSALDLDLRNWKPLDPVPN